MNGVGRCKRRRKYMAGGRVTAAEDEKIETANLEVEITEKPWKSSEITKPSHFETELDLYTQARKALSFRSPFDSEESPATQVVHSGANSLPSGVLSLLGRHSDRRKRHKRVNSGSEQKKKKKSTQGKPKGGSIWFETEEYFRELSVEDIELIENSGNDGFLPQDKCFLIPCLDGDDGLHETFEAFNGVVADGCEGTGLQLENGVGVDCNGKGGVNGKVKKDENKPHLMDVDVEEIEVEGVGVRKEENNEDSIENGGKDYSFFSGFDWLLGFKSKIFSESERPSKKQKLMGMDAGLEKLPVARPHMIAQSPARANGEVSPSSYIHPLIYTKLLQTRSDMLEKILAHDSACLRDAKISQSEEASSSSGLYGNDHSLETTSDKLISIHDGVNLDQLVKARNLVMLKLSPADEVEGELIYYQQRLLFNSLARKDIIDNMISNVVKNLPGEIDMERLWRWDDVMISRYNHELREARKQGRKERRHKEAQAVLAAATAAAASSSRVSYTRKDALEESASHEDHSQLKQRAKDTVSGFDVVRSSSELHSDVKSGFSKNHSRTCDVCTRADTVLNPVLVCSSCKVAVHLDCYCSVKSTTGPWHCESCEDLLSSQSLATNSGEKPCFVVECRLCGGTAGAFRKSVDGHWIHTFCAEWVLESTYRRGQANTVDGLDTVCMGNDTCTICRRKTGVCLKCSYGHCQSTFHPTCARSAGYFMTVKTNSGKLQHKAYCEKHSVEQRAKADTQKHGTEEFKSLKQVRVELERLRLLCDRIIKREKLKRELVLCSHEILGANRDSVASALARHPYYQPHISSESATTTSNRGYTDGRGMVQRSDDTTVDSSSFAGKRRVKFPSSMDNDQKTDDSSTSQHIQKPVERLPFSGKQVPQRISLHNLADNVEKQSNHTKNAQTFERKLVMISDQAFVKNQKLPKGFVYLPIRCLNVCSQEAVKPN